MSIASTSAYYHRWKELHKGTATSSNVSTSKDNAPQRSVKCCVHQLRSKRNSISWKTAHSSHIYTHRPSNTRVLEAQTQKIRHLEVLKSSMLIKLSTRIMWILKCSSLRIWLRSRKKINLLRYKGNKAIKDREALENLQEIKKLIWIIASLLLVLKIW